jgi:hypothetical protein
MAALAIEVHDMSRLVVPSPRRVPSAKEMAAFVSRLAPIEMAAASIHMQAPARGKTGPAPSITPVPADPPPSSKQQAIQGWKIPLVYTLCGFVMCLCNVLVPDGIVACAHLLCPVWTLALAVHAVAYGDPAWMWLGALTGLLLPFTLLQRDPICIDFFLVVFAAFGTGRFWEYLHGFPFFIVCACCFGLGTSCVLSAFTYHPRAQITVAAFFALSAAVASSSCRFGKQVLHIGL